MGRIIPSRLQAAIVAMLLFESAAWAQQADEAAGYVEGSVFRECAACPEMVVLPAGSFEMGSNEEDIALLIEEDGAEREWVQDELPRHPVTIAAQFAVGRYEVTRAEYSAYIEATGRKPGYSCYVYKNDEWVSEVGRNWRIPGYQQDYREPVLCANWHEAQAYIDWLNEQTGAGYRLLSEAEWEYAARAGTATRRYWGDDREHKDACRYANVSDLTRARTHSLTRDKENIFLCEDGAVMATRVGSFRPNAFGLYDMLGNVWEWVEDCYHDSYAGSAGDSSAWADSGCERRVLRGGSWDYDPRVVRVANRGWAGIEDRSVNIGFRVARPLP